MSLLKVHNLTYHIGDKTLYQNADFNLFPAEHVGVTGSNGVGKSTLLKLLQTQLLPDGGDIIWQPSVKVGYLDQHAQMDAQFRVRDYLKTAFSELYLLEAEMMAIYACAEKAQMIATLCAPLMFRPSSRASHFTKLIAISTRSQTDSALLSLVCTQGLAS